MSKKRAIRQYLTITLVQTVALLLVSLWMDGLHIQSFTAAAGIALAYVAFLVLYWWLFINFFSWLLVWLFPLVTFVLAGVVFMLLGNLLPGILITDFNTAIWSCTTLTAVNAILGGFLSLNIDAKFDQYITQKLVDRRGNPVRTNRPGFLFLEIDGLGKKVFELALAEGRMPTLKRWLDEGSHRILGWETDFTSQTGAAQAGILLGNNDNVPAYRWWDREKGRPVRVGNFSDAAEIEAQLSNGRGLLAHGGASRSNLFSGDAAECLFTISAITGDGDRRGTGPGYYLYLANPFTATSLISRYISRVFKEWFQALRQKMRRDQYRVSARSPRYAFLRAAIGPFLQDITTYIVIGDLLRGLPAIYTSYSAYDDLAHFAGMRSPEAMQSLEEIDHYFARLENVLKIAPRPYHTIVLSDHGQSSGPTFQAAYHESLDQLVQKSLNHTSQVISPQSINDAWDKVNTFVNDAIYAKTRMASVLRIMLQSKTYNGLVSLGPLKDEIRTRPENGKGIDGSPMVLASGCTGLIYFTGSRRRLTYEEIQARYPDLLVSLIDHPGIGFVLVRSAQNGDLVFGKEGIYFLDQDDFEGRNPLSAYPKNAARLLRRESSFANCPDILVNTNLDPASEELPGFENQASHHGGMGGPQNHPFIFHPSSLPVNGGSLVGAVEVNRLFRRWRKIAQRPAK